MESLSDSQQEAVRKIMSSESDRIRGCLLRAGMDEEQLYSMGTAEVLDAMASVMLEAEMAAATVPTNSDPKIELQLHFEMMRMQLEQRDREVQVRPGMFTA